MTHHPDQDYAHKPMLSFCWAVLGALLGVYLWHLYGLVYDSDLAILTSFAERLLAGHKFADMYYETNPPLSILIYVPVLWIQSISGLAVYEAHFFYTLGLLLMSAVLSAYLLWRLDILDTGSKHILLMGYVLTQVIVPSLEFGDRDHLVLMGLFPFALGQLALVYKAPVSSVLLWGAFIFGSLFILLKPHYGLIPTLLLLYRFIKYERFRVALAPDFLALAIGVLLYAFVLYVFFYDFLSVVFPDSLYLYSANRHAGIWPDFFVFGSLLVIFTAVLSTTAIGAQEKRILYFLSVMTLLLFIPYLVQGKALNYQRIPYLSLWFITGMCGVYYFLRQYARAGIALAFSVFCIGLAVVSFRGPPFSALSHEAFRSLPLSQALDIYCPQERQCRFLLLSDISDNIHRLGTYHGAFHASRFTSMWYLPAILINEMALDEGREAKFTREELEAYKSKYRTMVAQDLVRFKPDVIIALENVPGFEGFDFIEFFSGNPAFRTEFSRYDHAGTVSFDRRIYFPGMHSSLDQAPQGTYQIYTRRQ